MIYDCFTFFNELDLLEIRLNILDDVVDKFVLVEATKTFSNINKPLYFEENKERFKKFENKIIHIIVNDYPVYDTAWTYEYHQRNCIARGLTNCKENDVILISDLDEIPNPDKIKKYKDYPGVNVFKQRMFYYYLNNIDLKEPYWIDSSTRMLNYSEFTKNNSSAQKIRFIKGFLIENGGWHFSYLGGTEKIIEKIKSFSHQEYNSSEYTDLIKIKQRVENGQDLYSNKHEKRYAGIIIDKSFPKYIVDNISSKYNHLICRVNITFYDKLVLGRNKIRISVISCIKNSFIIDHLKKWKKLKK